MTYMKERIIEKLNEKLSRQMVSDMRFIQGTIDAPKPAAITPAATKTKRRVDPTAGAPYTDHMEDSELKEIITRIVALSLDQPDDSE
jgi:hypothetical protein